MRLSLLQNLLLKVSRNSLVTSRTTKMATASVLNSAVQIDGSHLEGGGQILRISTALSALLNKPISITRIRAGRKDGGLKAQHLTGIKLVGEIVNAKLTGDQLKSSEVTFTPTTKINSGKYTGDTKTAGSICLMLQNTLPCLMFADGESHLHLRGGTNAENAPQIDYFIMLLKPILKEKFGASLDCEITRRGYFPQGGGEIFVKVDPMTKPLNPVDITDFGKLKRIYGRAFVAGLPIKIAQTMATTAQRELEQFCDRNVELDIQAVKEPDSTYMGVGTGLILVAETTTGCILGGSALGKKGYPAPDVAKEAVEGIREDLINENCVDQYMQDQLIIFMALAKGKSRIKCGPLTLHTQTAIHFTQQLTNAKFTVTKLSPNSNIIECEGIGYQRPT